MRPTIKLEDWHYNGDVLMGCAYGIPGHDEGVAHISTHVLAISGDPGEGDVAVTADARYILGRPMMEVRPRARRTWTGAWIWIGGTTVAAFIALLIYWSRS